MELKNRIMEALDNIQKLTVPRSSDWEEIEKKKEAVKKEEDATRLGIIYNILKETVCSGYNLEGPEEKMEMPVMKVKMPDGSVKEYPDYATYKANVAKDVDQCVNRMKGSQYGRE